jgi:hypothetical protein
MQYIFAAICVLVCIVVLCFAYRVYKDTQRMKKKAEDDLQ